MGASAPASTLCLAYHDMHFASLGAFRAACRSSKGRLGIGQVSSNKGLLGRPPRACGLALQAPDLLLTLQTHRVHPGTRGPFARLCSQNTD